MIYRLYFDMGKTKKKLKGFSLGDFSDDTPTIEIAASDPDDACYFAYNKLERMIGCQDKTLKGQALISDVLHEIKIFWIEELDKKK